MNEVEELANSVDDSSGVCIVPAFTGLLAPYWRDDVQGIITGLTGCLECIHELVVFLVCK